MTSTMPYKITKTDAEWQALLKDKGAEPMAYQVTRHEATERAFTLSTSCPSTTPDGLALGPDLPWAD